MIAALNGMAVGGGMELALSADLILAAEHVRFALPEIRAGTLADAATVKLPKRIPYHVAMDMLLTGRWMDVCGGASLGPGERGRSQPIDCSTAPGRSPGSSKAVRRWSSRRSRR